MVLPCFKIGPGRGPRAGKTGKKGAEGKGKKMYAQKKMTGGQNLSFTLGGFEKGRGGGNVNDKRLGKSLAGRRDITVLRYGAEMVVCRLKKKGDSRDREILGKEGAHNTTTMKKKRR